MWFISATDWNRLAAVFESDNFLAAVLTFARDSGHILHIDDVGCVDAAEIFAELFFKLFHGETERVGGAVFFVDDDVMILGFAVENLLAKQSHFLVTVVKSKGSAISGQTIYNFFQNFIQCFFCNWFIQKPHRRKLKPTFDILMVAGDKNNKHAVVNVIDDVGGFISANGCISISRKTAS